MTGINTKRLIIELPRRELGCCMGVNLGREHKKVLKVTWLSFQYVVTPAKSEAVPREASKASARELRGSELMPQSKS
jgi:hypothetical protein